jgi:nucleotide-binding universal stress UspA family protein
MKIAVGVDWSDEAFAAVRTAMDLFAAESVTVTHAIDLRPFESPLLAPNVARQAYEAFKEAMRAAGEELLEATAAIVPAGLARVERVAETGAPADVLLDTARKRQADLLAVGTRGRSRLTELALGSVSHHVVIQAPCAVLVSRAPATSIQRIVMGVEGYADGRALAAWLGRAPFKTRLGVTVLSATPVPHYVDPVSIPAFGPWDEETRAAARRLVDDIAQQLRDSGFNASGSAMRGDPARALRDAAGTDGLIVVASHARTGLDRILLGSVSHAVLHAAHTPVLVVRMGPS